MQHCYFHNTYVVWMKTTNWCCLAVIVIVIIIVISDVHERESPWLGQWHVISTYLCVIVIRLPCCLWWWPAKKKKKWTLIKTEESSQHPGRQARPSSRNLFSNDEVNGLAICFRKIQSQYSRSLVRSSAANWVSFSFSAALMTPCSKCNTENKPHACVSDLLLRNTRLSLITTTHILRPICICPFNTAFNIFDINCHWICYR